MNLEKQLIEEIEKMEKEEKKRKEELNKSPYYSVGEKEMDNLCVLLDWASSFDMLKQANSDLAKLQSARKELEAELLHKMANAGGDRNFSEVGAYRQALNLIREVLGEDVVKQSNRRSG